MSDRFSGDGLWPRIPQNGVIRGLCGVLKLEHKTRDTCGIYGNIDGHKLHLIAGVLRSKLTSKFGSSEIKVGKVIQ